MVSIIQFRVASFARFVSIIFVGAVLTACMTLGKGEEPPAVEPFREFRGYKGVAVGDSVAVGDLRRQNLETDSVDAMLSNLLEITSVEPERIDDPVPISSTTLSTNFRTRLNIAIGNLGRGQAGVFRAVNVQSTVGDSFLERLPGGLVETAQSLGRELGEDDLRDWERRLQRYDREGVVLIAEVMFVTNATFTVTFDTAIGVEVQALLAERINADLSAAVDQASSVTFVYRTPIPVGYKHHSSRDLYEELSFVDAGSESARVVERQLRADFSEYPDDHQFGSNTVIDGMIFQSMHPSAPIFVNRSGTTVGLQFPDDGLTVEFPFLVGQVEIELADFNTEIQVEVYDGAAGVIEQRVIDRDNTSERTILRGSEIARIVLTGGGDEGTLLRLIATGRGRL